MQGRWSFKNHTFYQPATITSWSVVYNYKQQGYKQFNIKKLLTVVFNALRKRGMTLPVLDPPIVFTPPSRIEESIRAAIKAYWSTYLPGWCNCTTNIPPVLHYARLAAARGRLMTEGGYDGDIHNDIKNKMFYL